MKIKMDEVILQRDLEMAQARLSAVKAGTTPYPSDPIVSHSAVKAGTTPYPSHVQKLRSEGLDLPEQMNNVPGIEDRAPVNQQNDVFQTDPYSARALGHRSI